MKNEADLPFKDLLAEAKEVFWAGSKPPFPRMRSDERILSPSAGFRLPADYHELFDVVYLSEVDLGTIKEWPLIVDEALRLLAPNGVLVLRMSDSPLLSVFALKHQLFCWGQLTPYFEHQFSDHSRLFAVRNQSPFKRGCSQNRNVSFGVVTDGRKPDQLERFVTSICNLQVGGDQKVEILICGPSNLNLSNYPTSVQISLIPEPEEFREQGWITRKKNLIAGQAAYENLVIVHDRYFFPKDFLLQLDEYGFDFGVLSCKQLTETGERTPDWVTLGKTWNWTPPAMMDYGDWTPYVYINGGIIIGKTSILRKCPWNELLFWMQAEDVELTRRLQNFGYVPKFAQNVTAFSGPLRYGAMEGMEAVPRSREFYWLPDSPAWGSRELSIRGVPPNEVLDFAGKDRQEIAPQGVYLDEAWGGGGAGLELPPNGKGEITFRLAWHPAEETMFELVLKSSRESIRTVSVNGMQVEVECDEGNDNYLRLSCTPDVFKFSPVARIVFCSSEHLPLVLSQILVARNSHMLLLPSEATGKVGAHSNFVLNQSDSFWKYVYLYLRNNERARFWYRRLKQNGWLRSNSLARWAYVRLRNFLYKAK